jgi:hypothetical protein
MGEYSPLSASGEVLAYIRHAAGKRMLIALNLSDHPCMLPLEALGLSGRALLSTHLDREDELISTTLELRSNEGLIVEITARRHSSPS